MSNQNLFDKEFSQKYEQAVDGLSEDELAQIAGLDQQRLREWVYSPPKIRPHLLRKWKEEDDAKKLRNQQAGDAIKEIPSKIQKEVDKLFAELVPWSERLAQPKPKKKEKGLNRNFLYF